MAILKLLVLLAALLPTISGDCGSPKVKTQLLRIVGGKTAQPHSYPWQVAIFKYFWSSGFRHWCGGSLISNQWIMTAGHCVSVDPYSTKYKVKLGAHNKDNNNEVGMEIGMISEIQVHPNFDSDTTSFDVALMKLSKPINFTDSIGPICLPYQDEPLPPPGTKVLVTGWGLLKTGGSDSSALQEVAVPLVNTKMCQASYPGAVQPKVMFCAGPLLGGKDSCNGDSGGPLIYQDPKKKSWKQVGIVSWGDQECAKAFRPGVYSKVASFVDWIHQFTSTN